MHHTPHDDISNKNRELEKTVADLTQKLQKIEDIAKAKDELITNLSHEFRTPITAIMALARVLSESRLDKDQLEAVETISKSGDALLTLLNDILDFAKIAEEGLVLSRISFDLRICAEEVIELLAVKANDKNIDLLISFAPEVPRWVMGDPTRIRQMLINLVGNAIKFTHSGHVLIDVTRGSVNNEKTEILFRVIDTGIGIPEDRQQAIFERFKQANEGNSWNYGGTGLGLAITQKLVTLMEGNISLASKVGEGSVFSFTLPLEVDKTPHTLPSLTEDLEGVQALIVDPYMMKATLLMQELERMGVRCKHVGTSTEAYDILSSQDPKKPLNYHVVIIDNDIQPDAPHVLAKRIRDHLHLESIVLMLVSAFGKRGDATAAVAAGFSAYLTKPIKERQLIEAISAIVSAKKQGGHAGLVTHHRLTEIKVYEEEQRTSARTFEGTKVLLVEDNEVNQMLAKRVLTKLQCHFDVARNGEEATQFYSENEYDIIFMDCMLPGMDGYETTRRIRKQEQGKRTPIVAMTANVMKGDSDECIEAGMDDYTAKPIRPEKIAEMILKWV